MVDLVKRVVLLALALMLLLSGTFRVQALDVHDVAVVDVATVLPYGATEVYPDWKVNITVVVRNEGTVAETFNVTAYCNSTVIDAKTVADLGPGENETLTFIWIAPNTVWWEDVGGWILSPANYTIRAEVDIVGGETDINDNVFDDGSVKVRIPGDVDGNDEVTALDLTYFADAYFKTEWPSPYYDWHCDFTGDGVIDARDLEWLALILDDTNIAPAFHDVGLVGASVAIPWGATEVYPGWLVNITVVARNWGNVPETFTITAYCNTTAIGIGSITLATGEIGTLAFTGNITGMTPSAIAYQVRVDTTGFPDDYDLSDNTFTDGSVKVKMPGDVNGDGEVKGLDLTYFADAWWSVKGDDNYNPQCDFDMNWEVRGLDLTYFAFNWWKEI